MVISERRKCFHFRLDLLVKIQNMVFLEIHFSNWLPTGCSSFPFLFKKILVKSILVIVLESFYFILFHYSIARQNVTYFFFGILSFFLTFLSYESKQNDLLYK